MPHAESLPQLLSSHFNLDFNFNFDFDFDFDFDPDHPREQHHPPTATMDAPTSVDWSTALRFVKALFFAQHYRQCMHVCRSLLELEEVDPIQRTTASFFLALCYDEAARTMHHNSVAKLPSFDSAEQYYLEALTTLPPAHEVRELCTRRILPPASKQHPGQEDHPAPSSRSIRSSSLESEYLHRPSSRASSFLLSSPRRCSQAENIPFESPSTPGLDLEDFQPHFSLADFTTPCRVPSGAVRSSYASTVQQPQRLSFVSSTSSGLDQSRRPDSYASSSMSLLDHFPKPGMLPRESSRMSLVEHAPRPRSNVAATGILPRASQRMSVMDKLSRPTSTISMFGMQAKEATRVSLTKPHSQPTLEHVSNGSTCSISLLDSARPRSTQISTHGLMRPIRLGSPPQQHRNSPERRLSPSPKPPTRPTLPKLSVPFRHELRAASPQSAQTAFRSCTPEPPSPVSPISPTSPSGSTPSPVSPIATDGLEGRSSGVSTASACTPRTPIQSKPFDPPEPEQFAREQAVVDEEMVVRFTSHLSALRTQLEKHITSVQRAREQAQTAQIKRASMRLSTIGGGPGGHKNKDSSPTGRPSAVAKPPTPPKSLHKTRSFWSFAPEDQKVNERLRRIEAGRERKWQRTKFDPKRYQTLCENALMEL